MYRGLGVFRGIEGYVCITGVFEVYLGCMRDVLGVY